MFTTWNGKASGHVHSNVPGQSCCFHTPWPAQFNLWPNTLPWNSDCKCKFREESNPSHHPWKFKSMDKSVCLTTDVSAKAWIGVSKQTYICPSQGMFIDGLVLRVTETTLFPASLTELLSGICLSQETGIKSVKFSLQLFSLLSVNAQYKLQTSKFWMNPKI